MRTAELIRQARDRAGLDQRALAARGGCSQSALSCYERGTTSPSVSTLERLLAACGLQVRWELEPLWSDADAALTRPVLPLVDRVRAALTEPGYLAVLTREVEGRGVPVALAGALAAVIHGLPVTTRRAEVWVPDDDEALEEVFVALDAARAQPRDRGLGVDEWSTAHLRALPTTHWRLRQTVDVDLRVVPADRLARLDRVSVPGTSYGDAALDLPVLPLDALVLAEPSAARLLQRLLDRRAAGLPGAPVAEVRQQPAAPRVFP